MSTTGTFAKGEEVKGRHTVVRWPGGLVWEGAWTLQSALQNYRFENVRRLSPDELYVYAGRLLDGGTDELEARLVLRHIADKHPRSAAARRAVDRLASLREREELEAHRAGRLRAIRQSENNRIRNENAARIREKAREQQARRDARKACLASCEGKSREGFLTDYGACVSRCPL